MSNFIFPRQLLNQLAECTNGYALITLNENNDFEVYLHLPTSLTKLGMANFLTIFSEMLQHTLRNQTHE